MYSESWIAGNGKMRKGYSMDRLQAVIQINPEFAKAFVRGESWAMEYADHVNGLEGEGSRTHMDRVFDGEKQNWFGNSLLF